MTRIHSTGPALLGLLLAALTCLNPATLAAQVPDRSAPPELGPPPELRLPPIHRLELSNGARVVLLEKHNVPLVQVNLVVRAGSAMDSENAAGLASLTADMLDEGAAGRDALELADAIDFLGARLFVSAGEHSTMIGLHTPLSRLDAALELMADVVLRPDFPEDELERKRLQRLTTIVQAHDQPRAIASVAFDRTLYGDQHPYGRPDMGDEASLRAVRVADLRDFHRTYFRPNNAFFVVVGDITMGAIRPKLEALFRDWRRGGVPLKSWPQAEQVQRRAVYLVDKPGAAQSEIRIGRIGAQRLSEDYYALVVMNTILGGSYTSRLNDNLREQHGYTYGARSSFEFQPLPGPFQASAAVGTAVTDKALTEFFNELRGILEPVHDEELTRAKNYVALRFPSRFQTVSGIAGQLTQLVLYDLSDGYFDDYVARILAVTQEDVQRVAREYIDPERMAIIVVGDRGAIEEGVRGLGLGPINHLTIEDVLGPAPDLTGTQ
ncbi:MAG: insulinase family protein [Gemmatimonadota bacterium]|nr:MAG: insulinase family protein [Gemmatimonadota bacterium]